MNDLLNPNKTAALNNFESKNILHNDSISNIESSHQNEHDSNNFGIDITRNIVKKNAPVNNVLNGKKTCNPNTIIVNENLDQILYSKNKKKSENKIERLDFLASSFQNSFQSNSNNIEINKIPINNNKVFYNFHNLKSLNNNENHNKYLNKNNENEFKTIQIANDIVEKDFKKITSEKISSKVSNNLSEINNTKNYISEVSVLNENNLNKNIVDDFLMNNDNNSINKFCREDDLIKNKDKYTNNLNNENIKNYQNQLNNNNYNTINSGNDNTQKSNDLNIDELKKNLDKLDEEKTGLEKEIIEMRKKIKNIKREDYNKKITSLEKERDDCKKTANNYLHLCSQLAEEVIVLRNQLDKYTHFKKEK